MSPSRNNKAKFESIKLNACQQQCIQKSGPDIGTLAANQCERCFGQNGFNLASVLQAVISQTQLKNQNKKIMNKYLLHGKLTAQDGYGEKLTSILLNASKLVSTAKGCILYIVSKDTADINSVWITEIWDSKEDHDNSLKVEGVNELISMAIPILNGQPQKGQELEVLGGKGI